MVRWITFDDETAEAVVTHLRRGAAEIQAVHPIDAALGTDGPSIVLLPSRVPGRTLIAQFGRKVPSVEAPVLPPPDPPPSPKPWWKKLVA
jgi:hypothetical protein